MKTYRRRRRVIPSSHECTFFKRENGKEHCFFGDEHSGFFQAHKQEIHRKCEHCEEEEKLHRVTDKKQDDKEINRLEDKKQDEQSVHRMEDKKEDKKGLNLMKEGREDEKPLQRKTTLSQPVNGSLVNNYVQSMETKGQPINARERRFFQRKMGVDFSKVQIHTSFEASLAAKEINARAFAKEHHIVFKEGQFQPATREGQILLAHELSHVMQRAGENLQTVKSRIEKNPE
ncbi:MAG: hypothetical protein NVSMB67_30230 [Flavisolibacter sp.]